MTYLLDTSVFLWMALDETSRFSKKVLKILSDEKNGLYLSLVSAWEIAIKYSLHKLDIQDDPSTWIPDSLPKMGLLPLEIKMDHVLKVSTLEYFHRDPFDRLLISQSLIENLPFISPDSKLKEYGIKIIW